MSITPCIILFVIALAEIYSLIPRPTEILLTHTPPHAVLDTTRRGKNAGSNVLTSHLEWLDNCRLHIFGHIHEARGALIAERDESKPGGGVRRVSVNAAMPNYKRAIVVDLKN